MQEMALNAHEIFPNPANIFKQEPVQENQEGVQQEAVQQEAVQQQEQIHSEPAQEEAAASKPKGSEPSICIPRVFTSTTRRDIYDVIEKLKLGAVDRIDLVPKMNDRGEQYNKVFIHFKVWNTKDETAIATRAKLLKGEEIKIVYRDPWFWKCTASRVEKPAFRDYSAPPPRIDLGGEKSLCASNLYASNLCASNVTMWCDYDYGCDYDYVTMTMIMRYDVMTKIKKNIKKIFFYCMNHQII